MCAVVRSIRLEPAEHEKLKQAIKLYPRQINYLFAQQTERDC